MGPLLLMLSTFVGFTIASSLQLNTNNSSTLLSTLSEKNVNFASICDSPSSSSALNGQLWSPNYPNMYPNNLDCVYYINASYWLYSLELDIPVFHVEPQNLNNGDIYDFLTIEYRRNCGSWKTWVRYLTGQKNNLSYTFSNVDLRLTFFTDGNNHQITGSSPFGFTSSWKNSFTLPISPPKTAACAGPSVLFLLDRSEAIFQNFYNNDIKMFIAKLTARFAFLDDKTAQNSYNSRFGVIEFSDNATVSVPLGDYTRFDFIGQISKNVGYGNGGESNVTIALQLAYAEFVRHGVGNNPSSLAIVLVVNDISMFKFKQTLDAMATLKTIVQLPMGIIVPGLPGVPVNAKEHLTTLLGNASYAFDSLDAGILGIPTLSSNTFSCAACSGIIFICEATAGIGWDHKIGFLQLVQHLAAQTERSSKQLYAIALYGTQIYQHINLQNFNDFNQTLTALIENMNDNNLPDGGQTYLAPILNELYTTLTTNLSSSVYATLIMGQVTSIKDPSPASNAASKIAALSADVYVLDETHYSYPSIWYTLTQNKPNHIINGSISSNFDDIVSTLTPTLLKDFSNMKC